MSTNQMPWRVTLRCVTAGCPNFGNERQVNIPRPAEGFVELPDYRCAGCSCAPRQMTGEVTL